MVDFKKLREERASLSNEEREKKRAELWSQLEYKCKADDEKILDTVSRLTDDSRLNEWEKGFIQNIRKQLDKPERLFLTDTQVAKVHAIDAQYPAMENHTDVIMNKNTSKDGWLPVKKTYLKTFISVDEKQPPFDGSPVLVYTSSGVIQAMWEKGTVTHYLEGDEHEGFCWSTSRNDLLEIDEVKAWMPLPEKEHVSRPLGHSPEETDKLPHDPVLILSKTYGWVEAWYDKEEQVWQAMDADFTIEDEDVLTWETLPVLEDSVRIEWEEQEETEALNHPEETETEPVNVNFFDNF